MLNLWHHSVLVIFSLSSLSHICIKKYLHINKSIHFFSERKMVKKGKDGKKKKGKLPKAAADAPVHAFDLENINLTDLKTYVTKLEKELAQMRKDWAFYSVREDKIMDFLNTMRKVRATQEQTNVVNNSHVDDIIEQLRRVPEKYNEKTIIGDKESARKKQEKMFLDFLERNMAKARNFDEGNTLKQQISDVDKRLESSHFLYETNKMDAEHSFRDAIEEIDDKYSKMLEIFLMQYVKDSLRNYQDFHADKVRLLISIWDTKEQAAEMRESFINEIKNMHNFFCEIASNNNEVIKMLRNKMATYSMQQKKLNSDLEEMLQENMKLQEVSHPGFYHNNSQKIPAENAENVQNEKKLEKLQFKNDILKGQLRIAEKNLKNLQEQFTWAVRKVHQNADMKACVREEIIKMKLKMESFEDTKTESEIVSTKIESEKKVKDGKDATNIFSLRVEDSDTLFVPPVYHEFWDLSRKRHFGRK